MKCKAGTGSSPRSSLVAKSEPSSPTPAPPGQSEHFDSLAPELCTRLHAEGPLDGLTPTLDHPYLSGSLSTRGAALQSQSLLNQHLGISPQPPRPLYQGWVQRQTCPARCGHRLTLSWARGWSSQGSPGRRCPPRPLPSVLRSGRCARGPCQPLSLVPAPCPTPPDQTPTVSHPVPHCGSQAH